MTFNVLGLDIDVQGLAYDVQRLTSEVPGLRPGQTRPNLSPAPAFQKMSCFNVGSYKKTIFNV